MSKTILFFGNETFATGVTTQALIFKSLIKADYQIKALIIAGSKDQDKLEVVQVATAHHIPVLSPHNLKELVDELKSLSAPAAVLAAYGKIIPKEVLDLFKIGIINIHPSLLPEHRGPTPIESVILNGDRKSGVSIMRLAPAMDAGPIYAQKAFELTGRETKQELADRLDALGQEMLLGCLPDIMARQLTAKGQSATGATYDRLIAKEDGQVQWQKPWSQIERMIRAYADWPRVRATFGNIEVAILAAHFVKASGPVGQYFNYGGSLGVYCRDGLVVIDRLLPAGSKIMSTTDFLAGYSRKIFNN